MLDVQGDHSGCVKPSVDIKTKVLFYYEVHVLKRNIYLVATAGWEQAAWSPCRCEFSELVLRHHYRVSKQVSCRLSFDWAASVSA